MTSYINEAVVAIRVPEWFTYEADVEVDGGILHTSASGADPGNAEVNLRTQLVIDGWDPSDFTITIGDQRLDYGFRPPSAEEIAAFEKEQELLDINEAISFLESHGYKVEKVE